MATQILVVDDDVELRDLLRDYLARQGIEVSVLHDAGSLERRLERERPDLIVLDLMMPGVDGLTALRKLRASGDDIPVIMLTARADDVDRIVGLELGADDYLGKPFNPRELLARVQAVLRRRRTLPSAAAPEQREPFNFGRFTLDFQSRTLHLEDKPLTLSGSEFALLKIFVNHPMRTLTPARTAARSGIRRHRPRHRRAGVAPAPHSRNRPVHAAFHPDGARPRLRVRARRRTACVGPLIRCSGVLRCSS
jgi:two-component system, OmpR family, phosphate regulon response regulator OmpR